jgi:PTS system nitrogen regulatory IIA component
MENEQETGLTTLITRGGVHYQVPGTNPREVITNLVESLKLPPAAADLRSVDRDALLKAALEREALMTTAVGHGIALPHPRNPLITGAEDQFVALAFLEHPVDWQALDGEPVHTVLLIVSASAKLHLHTLSRINYFCQREQFRAFLEKRPSREEIIRVISDAEQAW